MVEVINKSNITIQKIEYNYDDTNPQYEGEAFIKDIKYSFEIKAKSGDFKKWDVSWRDDTWAEKYFNVRSKSVDGNKIVIELKINNKNMKVNGVTKEIDPGRDTVPQILNDRTIVPVRFVAENFGYEVE